MDASDIKMVDISGKPETLREAIAQGRICLNPQTIKLIQTKKIPKGDVLNVARCAGILAAKRVDELIPLCHPLALDYVEIDFKLEKDKILITARCKTKAKTGVEMEAMLACCISALTIYDMCKSVDRRMTLSEIKLLEKKGGRSGNFFNY
ncbi:MAG: cyclic pyranopterin monophosphate synthase MoaC [Candidatus Omnitrophica bacterium]|nr:cyclic pyranopterin monophosphate synthase MoaC [Candidatus Omnitrophota bacterium]